MELPSHSYRFLAEKHPYQFEYSRWAEVRPDTFATAGKDWLFIHYPRYDANIQLTYKVIGDEPGRLQEYITDAYKLTGKHQIRATAIQEQLLPLADGRAATIFKIDGDVPSPYQFYITDSTRHFMRGAIYFTTASKNDSLAPVIDFIKKDMIHLVQTLRWK
jgi:gliding motility-associated lipoprotein GldD